MSHPNLHSPALTWMRSRLGLKLGCDNIKSLRIFSPNFAISKIVGMLCRNKNIMLRNCRCCLLLINTLLKMLCKCKKNQHSLWVNVQRYCLVWKKNNSWKNTQSELYAPHCNSWLILKWHSASKKNFFRGSKILSPMGFFP